ncbi:collagen binding domain-containing protein, partial [Dellaglioa algida]
MGKMLKRIMVSLMGFFIIAVVAENNVQASDVGDRYVTNAELQDGNGDAQTSFDQYDNMQAHYEFTIPANSGVKAGDQMTVDLPKQLVLNKSVSFDIVNTEGVVIGKAVADKTTGKLTVTFTDYVETHNKSDITGKMSVWVSWNHDLISSGSSVPIDWGVAGETTINVNDGEGLPDKNEALYKWGSVDPADPTLIHWTVRLNYTLKNIKNAVYTDTLGKNQTLVPGSVDAAHGYYTQNTFNKTLAVPASQIVENGQTGFTITLGDLDDTVLMNYDARATDGGASTTYGNSGVLTGDDFKTSTVDVYTPENGGNGTGEGTDNGKPEVPKPEVPKPEVPKPEVPKPEVPKP